MVIRMMFVVGWAGLLLVVMPAYAFAATSACGGVRYDQSQGGSGKGGCGDPARTLMITMGGVTIVAAGGGGVSRIVRGAPDDPDANQGDPIEEPRNQEKEPTDSGRRSDGIQEVIGKGKDLVGKGLKLNQSTGTPKDTFVPEKPGPGYGGYSPELLIVMAIEAGVVASRNPFFLGWVNQMQKVIWL